MFHLVTLVTGSDIIPSYVNALAIVFCEIYKQTQNDPILRHYCSLNILNSIMYYSIFDLIIGLCKNYNRTSKLLSNDPKIVKKLYIKNSILIHHIIAALGSFIILKQDNVIIDLGSIFTSLFEVSTIFLNIHIQVIEQRKEIYLPKWITKNVSLFMFFIVFVISRFFLINYVIYLFYTKKDPETSAKIRYLYPINVGLQILNCYWVGIMIKKFFRKNN